MLENRNVKWHCDSILLNEKRRWKYCILYFAQLNLIFDLNCKNVSSFFFLSLIHFNGIIVMKMILSIFLNINEKKSLFYKHTWIITSIASHNCSCHAKLSVNKEINECLIRMKKNITSVQIDVMKLAISFNECSTKNLKKNPTSTKLKVVFINSKYIDLIAQVHQSFWLHQAWTHKFVERFCNKS